MTLKTSRPTPAFPAAGPREWVGLMVLALPTLLLSMDVTVLYLALPHLAADLRPSGAQLLWITDVYGFMIAGCLVAMGTLGDRLGRRRLLTAGAVAFGALSVVAAYAPGAEALIVARGLLGVAGATLMPSTLALISDMFRSPGQRATAIGIWAACLSGGVALGPVVGGALLEWFWWGSVFLIAVPVMALLAVAAPLLLPEHRALTAGRVDRTSVVLSIAAMLAIVYGIKGISHGDGLPQGLLAVGLGAAAGAVFWRRQRRLADALLDVSLFRRKAFSVTLVILFGTLAVTAGTYLFATRYLQQVEGLSPLAAGLWLVPSAVAMIVTSTAAPALARRLPVRHVIAASLAVSAAGFLMLALLGTTSGLPLLVAGLVVVYLGQGPLLAVGTDLLVGSAPPERAGSASAVSETGTELGLAFGVAVLGSVGTVAYRAADPAAGTPGLAPTVTEAVHDSVETAVGAAAQLAPPVAARLLDGAREAFVGSFTVVAGIAAVVALALAVLSLAALRPPLPVEGDGGRP